MSDELDEYEVFSKQMEERFPEMFSKPYGGFCVGKGWWPILEAICANIQSHIDWQQEQMTRFNRGEGCPQVRVQQIKEKFGGLRFYYTGGDDYIQGLVRMAEAWAAQSCEECGRPGKARGGGWVRTLCDEHAEEQARKLKEFVDEVDK